MSAEKLGQSRESETTPIIEETSSLEIAAQVPRLLSKEEITKVAIEGANRGTGRRHPRPSKGSLKLPTHEYSARSFRHDF